MRQRYRRLISIHTRHRSDENFCILGPTRNRKNTHVDQHRERCLVTEYAAGTYRLCFFSKKATEEARTRASRELALDYKKMVHFRTLHSLAFRQLGLKTEAVMRSFDYQRLETELGLPFSSTQSMNINDGEFFRIGGKGDMYLSIYNMARVRKVSLQEQFNLANNWNLQSIELDHVVRTYAAYKQALEKIDFVDMIEMFISQGEAPEQTF